MNNVRGLFPPLYGAAPSGGGGGGGGGQHIQVDALPEASLQYKDKIVQYTGATTDTITNGYFYKCVEHTETEGETITVTYSWKNVPVMENLPKFTNTESLYGTLNGVNVYVKTYVQTGVYYQANKHNIIDSTFHNNLVFACGNYRYSGGSSRLVIDGTKILKVDAQDGLYYETSTNIGDSSDTVDSVFIVFYTK